MGDVPGTLLPGTLKGRSKKQFKSQDCWWRTEDWALPQVSSDAAADDIRSAVILENRTAIKTRTKGSVGSW